MEEMVWEKKSNEEGGVCISAGAGICMAVAYLKHIRDRFIINEGFLNMLSALKILW